MKNKHYGDFGEHLAEVAADGMDITVPVPSRRRRDKETPPPPPTKAVSMPQFFRLLALRGSLKLEMLGMRHSSGRRASVEIRRTLTALGRKAPQQILGLTVEFERYIDDLKSIMRDHIQS